MKARRQRHLTKNVTQDPEIVIQLPSEGLVPHSLFSWSLDLNRAHRFP